MEKNIAKPMAGGETRRDFIKRATTAAAVVATSNLIKTPVYGQSQAPSPGRVIGANDRIVVGYIGVGNQGMAHVRSQKDHLAETNIAQAAVCDLWTKRLQGAKEFIGGDCQTYDDYRKLLERKDIDAVTIATVDHWHAKTSLDALDAGKHVYVEKPMTRYLGEAFELHDKVKKTGKVLQVGSQGCSDPKWQKAADLIRAGKLGQLVMGQGSYMRNSLAGEWNYAIDPDAKSDNVNWESWLGRVHKRPPFDADHYFRWRKYYPYCAGPLGDLVPHRLHPLMLATGMPEFPVRVACVGTRPVRSDRNTPGTYPRDVLEQVQFLAEFPSGLTLMVIAGTVNEQGIPDMIRGYKATVYIGGNRVDLKPEKPFSDDLDPETYENLNPVEDIGVHEQNWFTCIRENKLPNANINLAVRVQTVISLAEMSDRLRITCLFDEKARAITTGDGKRVEPITYGTLELS